MATIRHRRSRDQLQLQPAVEEVANKRLERWDISCFQTDWHENPLRVVRSLETTPERKRIACKWVDQESIGDRWRAASIPEALAPTGRVAVQYGHGRWKIENESFNELANQWHADHYFHQDLRHTKRRGGFFLYSIRVE